METETVKKILVELYNEYCNALIDAEYNKGREYTDDDFNSLEQFIHFINSK